MLDQSVDIETRTRMTEATVAYYRQRPEVRLILVTKSRHPDKYSDIDLFLFCEPQEPSAKVRRAFWETLVEDEDRKMAFDADTEFGLVDAFEVRQIEVYHCFNRVTLMHQKIEAIRTGDYERGHFSNPLGIPHCFLTAEVLHDVNGTHHAFCERFVPYPSLLKQRILRQETRRLARAVEILQRTRHRNDVLYYRDVVSRGTDSLLLGLGALNETYLPGMKSLKKFLSNLREVPEALESGLYYLSEEPNDPERLTRKIEILGRFSQFMKMAAAEF